MFARSSSRFSFRKAFIGIALGGAMLLGLSLVASADAFPGCDRRIAHERFELDRAVARHGFYSPQAAHERRELARLRYECSYRGVWR